MGKIIKENRGTKTVEIPRQNRYMQKNGLEIGVSSIIGTRSRQEDTALCFQRGKEALAVVCDGMGGLAGGGLASKTAAESLADAWFGNGRIENIPAFLKKEAILADEKVFRQKNSLGQRIGAGTTMAAVMIRQDELYWLSVGDSRIYVIRGDEILPVCRGHNYRLMLDAQLKQGVLTPGEYAAEEYRAEALISHLGMGDVAMMDRNQRPFLLRAGDIVLLSSDGLYRSLEEREILHIIKNSPDMHQAAGALTAAALGEKVSGQDNTSVIAVRYYEGREGNYGFKTV